MWSPSIRPETQVRVTNNPDHQETAAKCCSFVPEAGTAQRSGDSRNASALRPARRGSAVDANAAGIAGAGARSNARCAVNRDRYAARLEQLGAGCLLVLFFLSLLAAWNQETDHPSRRALQRAMEAEESYI
jgi:hypothetical protein